MGMADKRPKRMLMVVMFKAEHNQITQMWADLDKEGLGSKKVGCPRQAQTSPPARLPFLPLPPQNSTNSTTTTG